MYIPKVPNGLFAFAFAFAPKPVLVLVFVFGLLPNAPKPLPVFEEGANGLEAVVEDCPKVLVPAPVFDPNDPNPPVPVFPKRPPVPVPVVVPNPLPNPPVAF